MNCLSLNIRGIGDRAKVSWIRRLKIKHKINFIGIQETWFSDHSRINTAGCWDSSDFDFAGVDSTGRSGGLICIWNKSLFSKTEVIASRYFLIIMGNWCGIEGYINFVNVYGPQPIPDKRAVWEELLSIIRSKPGKWVLFGDFNVVRRQEERLNSHFCPASASDFNNFIQAAALKDFSMGGHKYTYFCQDGAKLSKLDRFLVCTDFDSSFPNSRVTALPRELSDHCPITLISDHVDFGPPPFRFFNTWLMKEDLNEVVKKAMSKFRGYGSADLYLAAKLRYVKEAIKKWKRETTILTELEACQHRKTIETLDLLAESRRLTADENHNRNMAFQKLIDLERISVRDLKQKARVKARVRWAIDGDENSKFFHGYINNRNRKNRINGIMVNEQWIEDPMQIKETIFKFYEAKFKESWKSRPKLISPRFRSISGEAARELEKAFTLDEIKKAVWACGSDRAPGPDGFTFKFIQTYWDALCDDIMNFVKFFEQYGLLGKGCNSSFITLAPKIKDPSVIGDYRPISLIGCLYKIITKTLASRLKTVIGDLIGEVQSAYIEGRNILDGPIIVNEIWSWAKRIKKKVLLFKVDFDKAFDFINWEYIDSVLEQMGFGCRWRKWIHGCLSSSRASVLVNGSPTKEFDISKGVRQGDPLSPFLFIIAMEGINVAMAEAKEKGFFSGIHIPNNGPNISHLLYADDALFIGEWSRPNLKNLARILRCFHVTSGLKVNFNKSQVFGINVQQDEVNIWANILGCGAGTLPFKYLGVPVGANMNLSRNWKPITDRFKSKLSTWKSRNLSFGGKITLIQAVLGSLPTYFLTLFKAPTGVLNDLEKIRRDFLWGGGIENCSRIRWVSWEKIVESKDSGGLGVGSLKALNIGLMLKWWWRLRKEPNLLWSKVITGIHGLKKKPAHILSNKTIPGVWNNIVRTRDDISKYGINTNDVVKKEVRAGNETLFWLDDWSRAGIFKEKFPGLYFLEKNKKCAISDRILPSGMFWEWKRRISSGQLLHELTELNICIGDFRPSANPDFWSSKFAPGGSFSVAAVREVIDRPESQDSSPNILWVNDVPKKVVCFVWRAKLGRIPSAEGLIKRGVHLQSSICRRCADDIESVEHIFMYCRFSREVFEATWSWCNLGQFRFNSISEVLDFMAAWGRCPKKRRILVSICYGAMWFIWKARNAMVFESRSIPANTVFREIQLVVLSWIQWRSNTIKIDRDRWFEDPLESQL